MRKAVGPFLKVFAYIDLVFFIVMGVVLATLASSQLALVFPSSPVWLQQILIVLGCALIGFFKFILLYGYGQAVQSLVRMEEQQEASRSSLREVATLLREQPGAGPACQARPAFTPKSSNPYWRRPLQEPAPFAPALPHTHMVEPPKMIEPEPAPQVVCSLCGTLQYAGFPSCVHCGASFVSDPSLGSL